MIFRVRALLTAGREHIKPNWTGALMAILMERLGTQELLERDLWRSIKGKEIMGE